MKLGLGWLQYVAQILTSWCKITQELNMRMNTDVTCSIPHTLKRSIKKIFQIFEVRSDISVTYISISS